MYVIVFVSILKQAHEDRNSEARVLLGKYQGGKNINDFLAITLMQNHGSTPHRRMWEQLVQTSQMENEQ